MLVSCNVRLIGKAYGESLIIWSAKFIYFRLSVEPVARKGIIVGIVLAFLSQCWCSRFFIYFSSLIFETAKMDLPSQMSAVHVFILLEIFGMLVATLLVDWMGRKLLLIVSLVACTIGLTAMAALFHFGLFYDDSVKWAPIACFIFTTLGASMGILPLPMICTLELLPTKVRTFGLTVGTISMTIFFYVINYHFSITNGYSYSDAVDLLLTFAGICVFGMIFVIFFMVETKGKTLDLVNRSELEANVESVQIPMSHSYVGE